jgi:ADP-heptose:LPS heptosyltransferase
MAAAEKCLQMINYNKKNERLIALYPSTDLSHRPRWQLRKMLNVARHIKKNFIGIKFIVVGSMQEGLEWATTDNDNLVDANFAGKISLQESAALISQCSLSLGNDGGLMHLAGAVKCPTVVIMPNTPFSYKPPGHKTVVIRSSLTCCTGRYPDRPSWCHAADCAAEISEETVYEACRNML